MSEPVTNSPDLNDRRSRLKFKMAEARQALLAVLQALQPADLDKPTRNEGWNVGQVAAHVAGAEGGMLAIAERMLAHDPRQRAIAEGLDLNRYNNSMIKRRAGQPVAALVEELDHSRARMLALLDQASDEDLDHPGYHPAYGETTLYGLFVIIYRHEREHTADIVAALDQG